jgi:hypothetical protein
MSALNKQVGGDHYKTKAMQPVELWAALDLNGFQASIVKYITRHKEKNGAADIDKAEHFFELMSELGQWPRSFVLTEHYDVVKKYRTENAFTVMEYGLLLNALGYRTTASVSEFFRNLRQENGYPTNGEG